jgi:hypothetical protein
VVRLQGEGDVLCSMTERPLRQKEGKPSGPRERARGHEARRVLRVWLQACVVGLRLHIFLCCLLVLVFLRLGLGIVCMSPGNVWEFVWDGRLVDGEVLLR